MAQIPLNFPAFYLCAIEGHTSLFKYDAVSVLLLGAPKSQQEQDNLDLLSGPEVTNYTSGKKRIKDTVMAQLLNITVEEAERRIQLLGIQDVGMVAYALKYLISKADLGPDIRRKLSEAYRNGFLPFIAEVFLASVKYPPKGIRTLTPDEKEAIAACWDEFSRHEEESPSPDAKDNNSAEPPAKKETESRRLSQEEITLMLKSFPVQAASKMHQSISDSPNVLYVSSLRQSGVNEVLNIILSSGITAFSNLFDIELYAGLPHFDFYEDQGLVNRLLFGNNKKLTVLHNFTPIKVSSLGSIEGSIAVALDREFFSKCWDDHRTALSLQFFSTKERGEYKSSMSGEMGNIFTGSTITALSDLISELFTYEAADMFSVGKLMGRCSPLFVGVLPFRSSNYRFEAYLLLDWQSAHVLMDKMAQFIGDE